MHWVDVVAREILRKGRTHVVASGTSISGMIHIGNAGDVIIAEGVCRGIRDLGGEAECIWIMDDFDPLRKIPKQLPEEFEEYLGFPVANLPCPEGCCNSFTEHFTRPFIKSLNEIGVVPKVYSDAEMYKNGMYDIYIKKALERSYLIRDILRRVAGTKKPNDWLPFDPVCEKCGKIATTHAYKFEDGKVCYRCAGGVAGKHYIDGCGHHGKTDFRNGKLAWRVEWAARWAILGVTCEPFGKEHAASGGSYDTSSVISREVFGYEPPYPVIYEHILVGGKKMSKSLGNVISLEEMLEVLMPEIPRYFFFRTKATKHKDFCMEDNLLQLIESYERVERLYYGIEKPSPQENLDDLKRAYVLSQVSSVREKIYQVPYTHLVVLVQIKNKWEDIIDSLCRSGIIGELDDESEKLIKIKAEKARLYVKKYLPNDRKINLLDMEEKVEVSDDERKFLTKLKKKLEYTTWDAISIHQSIHDCIKSEGISAKKGFQLLYKIFIGRKMGPRMGFFLSSLDKNIVLKRIEFVSK